MKITLLLALSACFCAGHARAQQARSASADAPLTNASVVKLVRAGFREKTVIYIIRTSPARFDLSPDNLIDLKRSGVSENIILVMLARSGGPATDAFDNMSDDSFFGDEKSAARSRKGAEGSDDSSTDIFGSSNGTSGKTRTRGASGASEGDTMTTGSATVRIIRPPVEPGATPRLEKTPTLNNDSIIELVEAGFTEGTIIRRIEQSPADFDFAPQKLAELRRRRVSDKIIAAMKTAMSDGPTQ